MASGLDILLLHGLRSGTKSLATVLDHELAFPKYDYSNHYVVQSYYAPVASFVREATFQAVIVSSSFLDAAVSPNASARWLKQYDFLRSNRFYKVAFPQDDYWFSEVRERFYIDNEFDAVFPVVPEDAWGDLFSTFAQAGGSLFKGQTAYFTPYLASIGRFQRDWSLRKYDVVYRATKTPKVPNKIGNLKGKLGDLFFDAARNGSPLRLDLGQEGPLSFRGENWYRFLGDSRAMLGSSSGSSVRLRNHEVFSSALRAINENPDLDRDELEELIFPVEDRQKNYTTLAPRNLEAAALGVVQLLTPGDYGGYLSAGNDYFEVNPSSLDASEVATFLHDEVLSQQMIARARSSFLENPSLRFETHRDFVLDLIRDQGERRSMNPSQTRYPSQLQLRGHRFHQSFFSAALAVLEQVWRATRYFRNFAHRLLP